MRNKRGALALSINAIVILIIAITMLGLALGFTRGMFGKAAGQFEELLGTEPEPPVPTGSDPVTLSKERIIGRAGEPRVIKVSIYNSETTVAGATFKPGIDCGTTAGWKELNVNSVPSTSITAGTKSAKVNARGIGLRKYETYSILFNLPSVSATTVLCKVQFKLRAASTKTHVKGFTIKIIQ